MTYNPTDPLAVTLEAQQWNQILALIAEGPYRIVAPIMQTMHEQLLPKETAPSNVYPMEAGE